MADLLQAAKLTLSMLEHRDAMRRIRGEGYRAASDEYRAVLRGVAKARSLSIAKAGLELCRELEAKGYDPSMMIAATVDELEGYHA